MFTFISSNDSSVAARYLQNNLMNLSIFISNYFMLLFKRDRCASLTLYFPNERLPCKCQLSEIT